MDLKLELKLDQDRCLQGESLRFSLKLTNSGSDQLTALPSLGEKSEALRLVVRSPRHPTWVGAELGAKLREFSGPNLTHHHDPGLTLAPRASTSVDGDLLWWVGELPVGDYEITGTYYWNTDPSAPPIQSAAAKLQVWKAAPTLVSLPDLPEMGHPCPTCSIWRHGDSSEKTVLFQLQSRILPPNPYHCVQIGDIDPKVTPLPATPSLAYPREAHAAWIAGGKLMVLCLPTDRPSKNNPTPIAIPAKNPVLLNAPRTAVLGEFLGLVASEKLDELYYVRLKEGQATVTKLPLEKYGPLGQACVFWTAEDHLRLIWTTSGMRELYQTTVLPEDPAGTFAPQPIGTASAEVLRIDLLRDESLTDAERANYIVLDGTPTTAPATSPSDESAEPRFFLFTLTVDPLSKTLRFTRRRLPQGAEEVYGRVRLGANPQGKLQALDSALTNRGEPVYLLKDGADALFFASTEDDELAPLAERVDAKVKPDTFPSLHAASDFLDEPWVFLRYVPEGGSGFVFAKLEPTDMDSPYELIEHEPGA